MHKFNLLPFFLFIHTAIRKKEILRQLTPQYIEEIESTNAFS
ncbi:hypothetical protein HMPREF9446_00541 [Bacteroides fluxus YIT 12057]|uniref:Uncharacterized protein n=1 Tax=Bacteroides fluxus YIT 12057 TaxID=763034 RepID=F3PPA1_9BACE|nr:hypothetical protein HMPREF9446_00541 [Bacteroides fluxus YIT 12057]